MNCTSLIKVSFLGNPVLKGNCFYGCTALESMKVPYGTTIIDSQFEECTNLKKLVLPKSVTEIYPLYLDWSSLEKLVIANYKCKLQAINFTSDLGEVGSYDYLNNHPQLTIIAPKGSEVIKIAKEKKVKYKEVSLPNKPSIEKITKVNGKKTVIWKRLSGVTMYQIYYSKTKNGIYTKLGETTSTRYTTDKAGYVKIRGYKTYEGAKWYGSFKVVKLP